MEQIIKTADTFLHVLEAAHSSSVSSWQAANLHKSLNWADHHQRIYQSYSGREKIRGVLDIELRKLAYRNCILVNVFGFEFLKNCKDFLISILEKNTSLNDELTELLPEPESTVESTQIFNCMISINKTLQRDESYVTDVINVVCDTVKEAMRFQQTCPVVTLAPQRSMTTLITRVYNINKTRELFLNCFLRGEVVVKEFMADWLEKFGSDLWCVADVKLLTKCSASLPAFCKLHILHIVKLFSQSYDYKSQHSVVLKSDAGEDEPSKNTKHFSDNEPAAKTPQQLIFGPRTSPTEDKESTLVKLSEHLVLLHATSCYFIVEELLSTLSKHQKYGSLARTYVRFLCPE